MRVESDDRPGTAFVSGGVLPSQRGVVIPVAGSHELGIVLDVAVL